MAGKRGDTGCLKASGVLGEGAGGALNCHFFFQFQLTLALFVTLFLAPFGVRLERLSDVLLVARYCREPPLRAAFTVSRGFRVTFSFSFVSKYLTVSPAISLLIRSLFRSMGFRLHVVVCFPGFFFFCN